MNHKSVPAKVPNKESLVPNSKIRKAEIPIRMALKKLIFIISL